MNDDRELLQGFVRNGSQADFEALVQRYTPMVFSSAQRRAGIAHAEDITQAVFIILAGKAQHLYRKKHKNIAGWLHTTTRYAALQVRRSEERRKTRERNASEEHNAMHEDKPPEAWVTITPLLDGALDSLGSKDRNALLLRFFRDASHAEVGQALGISENAANKRVERALAKLQRFFTKRGVTASAAALAAMIAGEGTAAAAPGLGASCAVVALSTSSAGAVASVATLASQTSTAMLVAQVKTMALTGVACSTLLGSTAVGVRHHVLPAAPQAHQLDIKRFAVAYKGRTELPDGTFEFQLNDLDSQETHFVKIGDHIMGYEVMSHQILNRPIPVEELSGELMADVSELTLESPDHTIVLTKDERTRSISANN